MTGSAPILEGSSSPAARTPVRVWVGLLLAIGLDVPVQLLWKALMDKYGTPGRGPSGHQFRWFMHQTRTWFLLMLFSFQFFTWMWVLGNADLSFAQPMTALSYVAVSTGAVLRFHEPVTVRLVLGIAFILAGVVVIGSSEHRTHTPLPAGPAS